MTDQPTKNTIGVTPDVVAKATADLPEEHRSAILWAYNHAVDNSMTRQQLAEAIHYSENTIYQIFTGSHGASKRNIVSKINRYRELIQSRAGNRKLTFIETTLSKKIWAICRAAVDYQRIGFIFGDSQIGKTTSLEEYTAQNNHGETIYVRMPEGGSMTHFLDELKHVLKIEGHPKIVDLKRRIINKFHDGMLLIVDEAHQCFNLSSRSAAIKPVRVLEFIREIHDRTQCGVVISATNVLRDEIENGKAAKILAQIKYRRLASLQLPSAPTRKDLDIFAAAYGLEPASEDALELQSDTIRNEALGMWLTLLRMTATRCHRNNTPLTWDEVIYSDAQLRKLEN